MKNIVLIAGILVFLFWHYMPKSEPEPSNLPEKSITSNLPEPSGKTIVPVKAPKVPIAQEPAIVQPKVEIDLIKKYWYVPIVLLCMTWFAYKVNKPTGRVEVFAQGSTERQARNAMHTKIKEDGGKVTGWGKDADEFGTGEHIIVENPNTGENFYGIGHTEMKP